MNPHLIDLWSQILNSIPNSKLALHATQGSSNRSLCERFEAAGIRIDRLIFQPRVPRDGYLDLYNQIDIALDPFPHGGGTTTLDALWMGVPVITLAGESGVSRIGFSILSQLGEPGLIATTPQEYRDIAISLANDPQRLDQLRDSLRARLENSSLMNAVGTTLNLEGAYRFAWKQWCRQGADS